LENPEPEAEPSNLRTTMPKRGLGLRSKSKSKAEAQQDSRKTVANNPKPAPRIESLPERTQTEPLKNNTQDFLEKLNLDTQQKKDILDVVQKDMLSMISEFKREFGSIIQPLTQQVARVSEKVNSIETDQESLDQKLKQMWEFCDSTNLKMPEIVISFKEKKICYDLNYKIQNNDKLMDYYNTLLLEFKSWFQCALCIRGNIFRTKISNQLTFFKTLACVWKPSQFLMEGLVAYETKKFEVKMSKLAD
jgi:hypothetical protein